MILSKEEVSKYMDCIKDLGKVCPLTDIHVSPFEVIFNAFHYNPNPHYKGVFSMDDATYKQPSIGALRIETHLLKAFPEKRKGIPSKLSIMIYRQNYAHIGHRVLSDHMRLSGISRSLLLPVVQPNSNGEEESELMFQLYGGDERFLLGYCVPNTVSHKDIIQDVKAAVSKYAIRAIKLHPNITEIDLSTVDGKQRVERILKACRETGLPLIIHGGLSPVLKNQNSRAFGVLSNLCHIDWSLTSSPVVISHAGMIGHSGGEIEHELLILLKRILSAYSNVLVDISALDLSTIRLILKHIDRNRIVFGSDAFYFPQWSAVVKLLHALKESVSDAENAFIQIAGVNPARHVFQEHKPY